MFNLQKNTIYVGRAFQPDIFYSEKFVGQELNINGAKVRLYGLLIFHCRTRMSDLRRSGFPARLFYSEFEILSDRNVRRTRRIPLF
jgi:hypothetical protein